VALCAQPFGWLTFVEVLETLLLREADVQKPRRVPIIGPHCLAAQLSHPLDFGST
jgi:hypothetical protein